LFADGDRTNCDPTNLSWGIAPENAMGSSVEYRSVPESEGYLFGSDGSVWSAWNSGAIAPTDVWRRLAATRHPKGHLWLRVRFNGKLKSIGVHHMICRAFHGPMPEKRECCHKDGNPRNNTPDNLYWGTRSDNIRDQMRHGVFRGSMNLMTKTHCVLSYSQAAVLREAVEELAAGCGSRSQGMTPRERGLYNQAMELLSPKKNEPELVEALEDSDT
jgi:hypothetical protein